jgi:DNA-binding transcriptional regulator YdaS (Cro superfamily)
MEKIIDYFNVSRIELSQIMGMSVQMIASCKTGSRRLSPEKARLAEKLTNGAVTKEQLRPDIYG